MSALLADLHWLRPGWLLLLPLLPLLLWMRRTRAADGEWRAYCDTVLLDYLGEASPYRARRWPLALLLLGWLIGVLALAGPSWERVPLPVHRSALARVVVLDLSRSMDANDVVPSRLTRARFKVADLLARAAGGRVGLVVFAGDAYALSPLTDDFNTLLNLVPALETALMPMQGSRADLGIEQAVELMRSGGARNGDILLITDGVPTEAVARADDARAAGYRVAVLAVGTATGSPIPEPGGGFVKDSAGRIVVPALDSARLTAVATSGGGRYATLSIDDSDIDRLLDTSVAGSLREAPGEQWRKAGQRWLDRGPWLLLALLPLAALAFRRGWLLGVVAVTLLLPPAPASALQWSDLWQRPEQRVQSALQAGDTEAALGAAEEAAPAWRGAALYKSGDYAGAVDAFAAAEDEPQTHYNRGNALARAGRLEDAIAAYDRALAEHPGFEDAEFNRALVEEMLRNQQQQEQQQQEGEGENQPEENAGEDGGEPRAGQDGEPSAGGEPQEPGEQADTGSQGSDDRDPRQAEGDGSDAETRQPQAADDGDGRDATQAEAQPTDDDAAARIEQMLRRVPDDPGGLLRRKFALEHQRRARQRTVVEQPW